MRKQSTQNIRKSSSSAFGRYDSRITLRWIAAVAVFWSLVAFNYPPSRLAPPYQAATRFAFNDRIEFLWRYTGPRPDTGEVLRLYARQASRFSRDRFLMVVCAGDERMPYLNERLHMQNVNTENLFDYVHLDIPPWPERTELWVGVGSAKNVTLWAERGDASQWGFDSYPVFRSDRGVLMRERMDWIGPVSARIVSADAPAMATSRPFVAIGIFAALLFAGVFLARKEKPLWLAASALLLCLFYKAMEALFPSQWLWGSYYLNRSGEVWFWAGMATLQVALCPAVLHILGRAARPATIRIERAWKPKALYIAVPVAIIIFTLIAFSNRSRGLYGDAYGSLYIPGYDYHNPFATAIYHAFRDAAIAIIKPGPGDPRFGYADFHLIPKFVAGFAPLYAFAALLLARELARSRREALLFFLVFMLLKSILLHFGYVEVYGPSSAVHLSVIYLVMRGYRTSRVVVPSLASFFGYLFHMSGALALPAVIALWLRGLIQSARRFRWAASRLAITIPLALGIWGGCLYTLYLFKHDRDPKKFETFVPAPKPDRNRNGKIDGFGERMLDKVKDFHGLPMLFGSTGLPSKQVFLRWKEPHYAHFYALPTFKHVSQIASGIVFIGGPIVPLLGLAIVFASRRRRFSAPGVGLTLTAAAYFAAAFALATNFPYPKDWDIFSTHILWWTTALLWFLARARVFASRDARWILAALLLYLLWDTLPWVYYNLTWGPPAHDRSFVFL